MVIFHSYLTLPEGISHFSHLRLVNVPLELHPFSPGEVSEHTRLQHATNVALIQVAVVEGNTSDEGKQEPFGFV